MNRIEETSTGLPARIGRWGLDLFVGVRGKVFVISTLISAVALAAIGVTLFLVLARAAAADSRSAVNVALDQVESDIAAGRNVQLAFSAGAVEVTVNPPPGRPIAADAVVVKRTVVDDGGREVSMEGRATVRALQESLRRLRLGMMAAVPVGALSIGLASALAIDRAFAPVTAMIESTRRINARATTERLPVPDSGDEVAELAVTINEMLGRIDAGVASQRSFVSDASHELRTPLMALIGELELAQRHPELTDFNELVGRALRQTNRLELLVDDLLALASLEERTDEFSMCQLDEVVAAEVGLLSVDAELDLEPARCVVSVDAIRRVLANLVANAERHRESVIAVRLKHIGEEIELVVDDDGPGVPADRRRELFGRFRRDDLARDRDRGGSGLGLAIVEAAAALHDGRVIAEDSPLGGARFGIVVPCRTE